MKNIEFEVILKNEKIDCKVEKGRRKTIAVSVQSDGTLLIKSPLWVSQKSIIDFLKQKENLILKHRKKTQHIQALPACIRIFEDATIPIYGENLEFSIIYKKEGREIIENPEGKLILYLDQNNVGYEKRAEVLLEKWYRKKGKVIFSTKVEMLAKEMGIKYQSISIKNQKTRWGSCSSKGNLNFKWRLLLMPKEELDYCVIHELAHIKEMNHSALFWNIVAKHMPSYKEKRKFLKENGAQYRIEI